MWRHLSNFPEPIWLFNKTIVKSLHSVHSSNDFLPFVRSHGICSARTCLERRSSWALNMSWLCSIRTSLLCNHIQEWIFVLIIPFILRCFDLSDDKRSYRLKQMCCNGSEEAGLRIIAFQLWYLFIFNSLTGATIPEQNMSSTIL